jgi:hypothetical protein
MTSPKPCELCGSVEILRRSHVVPAFVYRWLREGSPGKLRTLEQPNLRVQDGPTREWLCDSCEQRFSDWEKPFAEEVFQYVHSTSKNQQPVPYREWALKFAVSVSWRTLRFYREKGLGYLSAADIACLSRAEDTWRDFLLGRCPHPGEFEQHVILVDTLEDVSGPPISPFLNRYFLRAVHTDVVTSKPLCITYTKLCRVIVVGIIRVHPSERWRWTRLHLCSGRIGGSGRLPGLFPRYWNDKANQVAAAMSSLSPRQLEKIDEVFANCDPDLLAQSETFRAMVADVDFSGENAFRATGPGSKDGAG